MLAQSSLKISTKKWVVFSTNYKFVTFLQISEAKKVFNWSTVFEKCDTNREELFFSVKRGAKVAIYDLNVAGEKLAGSLGDNCIFLQGDVCDSETLATSIEKTETSFGAYITLNVNCAGTATSRLLFDQNSDKIHCEKSFDRVMKTNVYGTFNVMRHLSKAMAKNKGTIEV